MFLNKKLCANGISLRVETRIELLNEEHLTNETVKFSLVFSYNAELALFKEACIPLCCQKVFTDHGIFMFNNRLM